MREGDDHATGIGEAACGQQRHDDFAPLLIEAIVLARLDHDGEWHVGQSARDQVELIAAQGPQFGAGPIPHVLVQNEVVSLGDAGLNLDEFIDIRSQRSGLRPFGNASAVIHAPPGIATCAGLRRRRKRQARAEQAARDQGPFQGH